MGASLLFKGLSGVVGFPSAMPFNSLSLLAMLVGFVVGGFVGIFGICLWRQACSWRLSSGAANGGATNGGATNGGAPQLPGPIIGHFSTVPQTAVALADLSIERAYDSPGGGRNYKGALLAGSIALLFGEWTSFLVHAIFDRVLLEFQSPNYGSQFLGNINTLASGQFPSWESLHRDGRKGFRITLFHRLNNPTHRYVSTLCNSLFGGSILNSVASTEPAATALLFLGFKLRCEVVHVDSRSYKFIPGGSHGIEVNTTNVLFNHNTVSHTIGVFDAVKGQYFLECGTFRVRLQTGTGNALCITLDRNFVRAVVDAMGLLSIKYAQLLNQFIHDVKNGP